MPPHTLTPTMNHDDHEELFRTLRMRFEDNMQRHEAISWSDVRDRLDRDSSALESLSEMEATGGEPDVIGRDEKSGTLTFCDCAAESPAGRRSLCFDDEALAARKKHKPRGSAAGMAASMCIDLLTEEDYRALQTLGEFDTATSTWIATPPDVRALGGALFCDRRYDRVFVYHNGAQSYYAARGFRGILRV